MTDLEKEKLIAAGQNSVGRMPPPPGCGGSECPTIAIESPDWNRNPFSCSYSASFGSYLDFTLSFHNFLIFISLKVATCWCKLIVGAVAMSSERQPKYRQEIQQVSSTPSRSCSLGGVSLLVLEVFFVSGCLCAFGCSCIGSAVSVGFWV